MKRIDKPTLFIHGDDDQIAPIGASAAMAHKLARDATLNVYAGADRGLTVTHQDRFNADLLAFIQS